MTLRDVKILEVCRKVEQATGRLYQLLARLHGDDAGMAALWAKTAREEENHARQVEMVMRRRSQMAVVVRADPGKAEKALALVESAIAASTVSTPSTRQALEEAITLENVLMQFHADYAVEFTDAADQNLFRSMMAADRDHVGALQAALEGLARR